MAALTFNKVEFKYTKTFNSEKKLFEYKALMQFHNRKEPIAIVVEAAKKDHFAVLDTFDTLAHESVQRRLEKDMGIGKPYMEQLGEIRISNDFGPETMTVDSEKKIILLSFLKARDLRGDGLAWVLSGGSDKGFAYPWVFKQLEDMGLLPNFVFATSTAAYFGGLYCFYQSAAKVIDLVKGVIRNKNWHQLVDLEIKEFFKHPKTYKGFIAGRYLMKVMNEDCGLKDVHYSDLKIPLYVLAVRMPAHGNHGKPIIFCDPRLANTLTPGAAEVLEYDYKVVVGARTSGSIPVGIAYYNYNSEPVKDKDGNLILSVQLPDRNGMDGGLYRNLDYEDARRNKDVGYIVGVDLGDNGENEAGINNFIEGGAWAFEFIHRGQKDGLPNKSGVVERYFNPNFRKLESLKGLENGQLIGLSAAHGISRIAALLMGGKVFSMTRRDKTFMDEVKKKVRLEMMKLPKDKQTPEKEQEIENELFIRLKEDQRQIFLKKFFSPMTPEQDAALKNVATVGPKNEYGELKNEDVVYFEEKEPLININRNTEEGAKIWNKVLEPDGGHVLPKPIQKSAIAWLWLQSVEQINVFRTTVIATGIFLSVYVTKLMFWTKQSLISKKKKD
jgi:predicted acylesterase/phospholipase RssA